MKENILSVKRVDTTKVTKALFCWLFALTRLSGGSAIRVVPLPDGLATQLIVEGVYCGTGNQCLRGSGHLNINLREGFPGSSSFGTNERHG
eukprot:NODE_3705_length_384_cov_31.583658_g3655_i0.p1 GENE.NODE_3705_length_384_cov_31.583658_g3655_i0~~NODE_3705_length_384_cov_31.583658_g3655_i0.p1  ORF type:complete len:104 (+),score=16.90 NODE_3705_length_384_cov_31.583658_g3655_i0:40-312(+)